MDTRQAPVEGRFAGDRFQRLDRRWRRVFRFAGHRTMAQITNFDLILVLIIGGATQNALVGDDTTVMTATVAIGTLVLADVAMGRGKQTWPVVDTSATVVWLIVGYVWTLPYSAYDRSVLTFVVGGLTIPLAFALCRIRVYMA